MKDIVRILMLVILTMIFTGCFGNKKEEQPKVEDTSLIKRKIESQIGFKIPDFEEISRENGDPSFRGDYTNTVTLKFNDNVELDNFYNEIENRIIDKSEDYRIEGDCVIINDFWRKEENGYKYSFMSECSKKADKHFELIVNSNDRTAIVSYGNW